MTSSISALRRTRHSQVLLHGERAEERPVVGHEHDAGATSDIGTPTLDCLAVDEHLAALARQQADDGAQQRGLARAVRPEHGEDGPGVDCEIDRPHHGDATVAAAETPALEQRRHHAAPVGSCGMRLAEVRRGDLGVGSARPLADR